MHNGAASTLPSESLPVLTALTYSCPFGFLIITALLSTIQDPFSSSNIDTIFRLGSVTPAYKKTETPCSEVFIKYLSYANVGREHASYKSRKK